MKLGKVNRELTEKQVEQYLIKQIQKLGGTARKYNTINRRSAPDRICLLPYGILIFIECKRPGKTPTPAQFKELNSLVELGFKATWVDSKESIDKIIELLKQTINFAEKKIKEKRVEIP